MKNKNATNFWDFANENPMLIYFIAVFACVTIVLVTGLLTHKI
jgi:hypothetical protein